MDELKSDDLFYPIIQQYLNLGNDEFKQVTTEHGVSRLCENAAESSSKINEKSSIRIFDHTVRNKIDLIVCLGGDGTLLQIGSMFQVYICIYSCV